MNLVDEEYGRGFVEEAPLLSLLNHIAHILYSTRHCAESEEGGLELVGYYLSQGGLAHSRWSPWTKPLNLPDVTMDTVMRCW